MTTARPSIVRHWFSRVALLSVGLFAAWMAAEVFLQWRSERAARGNRLEPGMMLYDPAMGWRLAPGWSGRHEHADYTARYTVNRFGCRADTSSLEGDPNTVLAVVGDSFTFGYGVNDDETFVHHLAKALAPGRAVANFAVPGTSTDQQLILVRKRLPLFDVDEVVLVVYLGNDLLDNMRATAIQAPNPKPYFTHEEGEVRVQNSPVPRTKLVAPDTQLTMRCAVLGEEAGTESLGRNILARSRLLSFLWSAIQPDAVDMSAMRQRHEDGLDLFDALIGEMHEVCRKKGARLHVVLLAGRSHGLRPESLSARYQEMLRQEILRRQDPSKPRVIDLAGALAELSTATIKRLYFPTDGHLTPEGNRLVAEILLKRLRQED